jgi:GntR family transcriptional regulator / MocR family aminotransferase
VKIGPAEAGIHLLASLPEGVDDVGIATEAQRRGIALTPLSPHFQSMPQPGLLLGFGALDEAHLVEGVRLLAPIIRGAMAERQ